MQPAITVIKTPTAEFRCQRSLAPFDRRLLRHPAGQHGQAQAITGQLVQLVDFLGREKRSAKARPSRADQSARGPPQWARGIAQQHPITAMAEADPTALQLRGLARWTVQRHRRRVTSQGFRQHLAHGRPAVPIALAAQGDKACPQRISWAESTCHAAPCRGKNHSWTACPLIGSRCLETGVDSVGSRRPLRLSPLLR